MPEGKSEYPADVVAAAYEAMNTVKGDGAVGVISRAILTERQRCAKIASEWGCSISGGIYTDTEVDAICATIGPNISDAILHRGDLNHD